VQSRKGCGAGKNRPHRPPGFGGMGAEGMKKDFSSSDIFSIAVAKRNAVDTNLNDQKENGSSLN
jgi:hypothetical protein